MNIENTSEATLIIDDIPMILIVDKRKSILDNLLINDISIRNICHSGICGSCKFLLKSGSIKEIPDFCLSELEKINNIHLACCSYIESEIVEIKIP